MTQTVRPVAVIDIGTSSIRMAIAEIDEQGGVRHLESLSQAVNLGKDTFTFGSIEKETIEECVRVLRSYQQKLQEYGISDASQVRIVATSAVREAKNRLAFLDRVFIATGMEVTPVEEAEVNRITYLGVQPSLQSHPALHQALTVVAEVGGGSTELLLVKEGNVLKAHTFRLGSLRLRETLEAYRAPTVKIRDIMQSQIDRTVQQVRELVPPDDAREMVALGGDVRFAADELLPGWNSDHLGKIPLAALRRLTNEVIEHSVDELVRARHLSFPDAETLGPALLVYARLAESLELKHLYVSGANLRDGLLEEMARQEAWTEEFSRQIVRSAIDLGRKFDFDERHAIHSAELSKTLFEQLKGEHRLPERFQIILYVAALLHEVGLFISNRSYHKHTMYLIENSEIFGLGRTAILLAALVARYHRRASPLPSHEGYATLDREQRVVVAKLAGILRLAIALDESRSSHITDLRCTVADGRLTIWVRGIDDLSLEQLALAQSGGLFEETFGLQVALRRQRGA